MKPNRGPGTEAASTRADRAALEYDDEVILTPYRPASSANNVSVSRPGGSVYVPSNSSIRASTLRAPADDEDDDITANISDIMEMAGSSGDSSGRGSSGGRGY